MDLRDGAIVNGWNDIGCGPQDGGFNGPHLRCSGGLVAVVSDLGLSFMVALVCWVQKPRHWGHNDAK